MTLTDKKMLKSFFKIMLMAGCLLLVSCGGADEPLPEATISQTPAVSQITDVKKQFASKYSYQGTKNRDPFMALVGRGSNMAISEVSDSDEFPGSVLTTLTLRGLVTDSNQKCALVSDTGGANYAVKGGKVYDYRGRVLKGIVGIVKEKSVILITSDKTIKELKLTRDQDKEEK